ncbi:efflux RND transporter periplasmic adaptor subunit [Chitinophaga arvensicola]|uniref:Membrane fusion protein, cobalt-zinc-cadmium efflux system n=1 Tax=Chitinophaga arvensicola TaxID=29529 RepID=A0A1I0S764_9BACT|nr:efflux RND transporter periplasmic adaptor subunit [Chitinophaga arvensicola]SEW51554.1 membrane fusion protein, cobalt-zinc-cadmium efflux system [Chitinophaga arvensicola]
MRQLLNISHVLRLLLIMTMATLAACGDKHDKKEEERTAYVIPDSIMKVLKIDTARMTPMVDAITLTGMVDFNQDNQVSIFPPVSGIVQGVTAQLGDVVKQGQVLAVVRSSEMAGYENNMVAAETNVTSTRKQLEATKDLFKNGLSSQLDMVNAQTAYDQAVAQLQMVQRVLKINGNNRQGVYEVKSPINGFIVQKNITNNTVIRTDNGNNLFTISDLKNVWVQANVYESNVSRVHVGDNVDVTTLSYPDKVFKGKVGKTLNVLDPSSKVMKVRIELPNEDYLLKPQMFANVNVLNPLNQKAITISSHALIFDHSQYYVLLYNSNSDVRITPVQVLGANGNETYISAGLKEGDKVIAYDVILIYQALNS